MGIAVALGVGAAVSAIGGAVGANQAKQAAKGARGAQARAQQKIENLKRKRPTPINPYSSTKDLSEMAQDLSGQLTNAFSNLGVATQAAEIQMEQTDIALANTLDTLRATGASAGGATALAQAALQSKKGIAASIEQQEAQNEKLKAQGQQQLQQQQVAEQQRLQSIAIAEGRRVQAADAAGKQFEFQTKESRINADLDRASGQERQAAANVASANQAKASAISGAFGGVTSMIGSAAGGGAFG